MLHIQDSIRNKPQMRDKNNKKIQKKKKINNFST